MPDKPWYNQTLNDLFSSLDTSSWSDQDKRDLAPIDSYLMWNKLRGVPGGQQLYDRSPSPVMPLLRGIGKFAGNLVQGKTDLPVELQQPVDSLLGRYSVHIPYVDPQGTYSQHGVTFRQNAPSIDWMAQNLAGYDKSIDAAGLHRGSAGGMTNYISADPSKSLQELLLHEQGGHGTTDLLTGIHGTPMEMGAQAQQRFYNRLPLYARQQLRASPNPAQMVGENLLDKTPDDAPQWVYQLQQNPLYSSMPKPEVGNEILAYTNQYQYPEDQYLRDDPWRKAYYRTAAYSISPRADRQPGDFTAEDITPVNPFNPYERTNQPQP